MSIRVASNLSFQACPYPPLTARTSVLIVSTTHTGHLADIRSPTVSRVEGTTFRSSIFGDGPIICSCDRRPPIICLNRYIRQPGATSTTYDEQSPANQARATGKPLDRSSQATVDSTPQTHAWPSARARANTRRSAPPWPPRFPQSSGNAHCSRLPARTPGW